MAKKLPSKERLAWGAVSAVAFLMVYFIVVPIILGRLPPQSGPPFAGTPIEPLLSTYQVPVRWLFDNSETYAEFIVWTMEG